MNTTDTERYAFTDPDTLHKLDSKGSPDFNGTAWHLVEEHEKGYTCYIVGPDSSQPQSLVFIAKEFVKE